MTALEALALIAANRDIDMVVSDINMPRMDGLSLLQKLQEAEEQLSTIIVSAYGDMANIRTAMNRGAFDFLTKPIDFADLETTIAKTLRHLEVLREARRRQAAAERAHASLSRYFSPNLAERLAGDADGARSRRPAARGRRRSSPTSPASPRWSRRSSRPRLAPLLNDYLVGMTDIVFAHEGTVAKIVGDALHVLFGAPGDQPDHAARAVACALDLDAFSQSFRERWREQGIALGATRIGVHAGPAIVGNFGGGRFFDYTAYGDTINIAARLEAGQQAARHAHLRQRSVPRSVRRIFAAGRSAISCCGAGPSRCAPSSRCGPSSTTIPSTASYLEAFAKLEAGDPGALAAFAAQVGKRPDDQLASFHLKRLLNGATGTRIAMD